VNSNTQRHFEACPQVHQKIHLMVGFVKIANVAFQKNSVESIKSGRGQWNHNTDKRFLR